MKISPIAQGSGTPGQALDNVDVGRTANPMKLERARAIARGEKPPEATDSQVERIQSNARRIKMRVNRSPEREEVPEELVEAIAPVIKDNQEVTKTDVKVTDELTESSTTDTTDKGTVEVTQPLSPQFAALAKQKRALQLERAEFDKLKNAPNELVERLKTQPLKVLQEHGVTYDQLTEAILNDGGVNPEIEELKKEIKALKEGVDKSFETRETQAEEAALTEMLYEAEGLAKEGETYEFIREQNAYDKVLRLIHKTYKDTGRVMDVSQAMDKVEADLFKEAERLANLSKVRAKFGQPPAAPLQSQQPKQMKTLTARDSASSQMSSRQRAIAAFNGTLKR